MRRGLLATLLVCACVSSAPSAPRPQSVAPARVAAGTTAEITVKGVDFFAEVTTDFGKASKSSLVAAFEVRLQGEAGEDVALENVTLVDSSTLTAEVPASAPRALYDVTVTDPGGRSGTLTGALRLVTSAESVAAFEFDPLEGQIAGVPFVTGLTAVDELGNRVEGFDGTVDVSAPGAAPLTVGPFALGRARGFVTVPLPATGVTLSAADALGHAGTSQAFDVTPGEAARVEFVEAFDRVAAGACAGPFTVEVQDTFGNPAAAGGGSPFTVSVNPPEGGTLFSDAACASPTPGGVLQGRASFFVRSTKAGRPELRVVPDAWPSAVRAFDVDAGAAVGVQIASAPQVLAAGMCSQPVVVRAVDSFGNPAEVGGPVDLAIALEPATGVTVHDDGTCATALNALQLVGSEARFHFRSAVPAMLSLSVDAGTLGVAVQAEEVTP